jgi:hypothetical protein
MQTQLAGLLKCENTGVHRRASHPCGSAIAGNAGFDAAFGISSRLASSLCVESSWPMMPAVV